MGTKERLNVARRVLWRRSPRLLKKSGKKRNGKVKKKTLAVCQRGKWFSLFFFLFLHFISSFILTLLRLPPRPPWHSIIELARTSRFPVPHVWNPITRQQFMLCEDALLFQYWDVKLHTGLLMHSGNHSLLLRLPARKLSVDPVTGEGGIWISLSLFWPWLPLGYSLPLCPPHPPSSLYLSGVPRRGFIAQSSMAGAIDEEASILWQLTFTRRLSLACPRCWLHGKQTDKQTAGNASEKTGRNCFA